ncbi:histidinol dehydrogenase, partial [bacterium]|nr:histidinol dehydrogenase [bacterium]
MKKLRYWIDKDKKEVNNKIKRDLLSTVNPEIISKVSEIIAEVKENQDQALIKYTELFDQVKLEEEDLRVKEEEFREASKKVEERYCHSLMVAKKNIIDFHERQKVKTWEEKKEKGIILGQRYQPIDKVGIYIPGGRAPLVSSVLMTVIPALVAGVKEIFICTPPNQKREINPYLLMAAKWLGIKNIYKVGGAQAIAALAYGTKIIPAVDKIVGPGNIYVTIAKKLVYGKVSIDMIAGPSEVLILADEKAKAKFVAADLLSQAEHDELSSAVLITTSETLALEVEKEIALQKERCLRKEIIERSLENNGLIILIKDIPEGIEIINSYAP